MYVDDEVEEASEREVGEGGMEMERRVCVCACVVDTMDSGTPTV